MGLGGGIYDGDKTMEYELNQVLAYQFRSPKLDIGETVEAVDTQIEIFDPELALIGKLDKIPVMRSLRIILEQVPDILYVLIGDTANFEVKWLLQLFNDSQYNNPAHPGSVDDGWNGKKPNLLAIASRYAEFPLIAITQGGFSIETLNFNQNYIGGIPLKPKLLFRNEIGVVNAVAGGSWGNGSVGHGIIFIEIDWTPVNKKEFDEYIREYIYVQE